MGFRFRKSIGAGPFRLNFSKSGIGYSVGTKGYRVTKTANGRIRRTASLPGTGISYVEESNSMKSKNKTKKNTVKGKNNPGNNKKSPIISILVALFVIFGIGSCGESSIESIAIVNSNKEYDINQTYEFELDVNPEDAYTGDLEFVCTNDEVISYYEIVDNTLSIYTSDEGKATFYLQVDEIQSNKIDITVINKEKDDQEQIITNEEDKEENIVQFAPTNQESSNQNVEKNEASKQETVKVESNKQESSKQEITKQEGSNTTNSNDSNESKQETSTTQTQTETPKQETQVQTMVWIAGSGNGSKYHSKSGCSNMNNPIEISLENAKAQGYSPCKKCH